MGAEGGGGKGVYFASIVVSKWDKSGADNEQVLRGYRWDGHALTNSFEVDFTKERLGPPPHMKFTAKPIAQVPFGDHAKNCPEPESCGPRRGGPPARLPPAPCPGFPLRTC